MTKRVHLLFHRARTALGLTQLHLAESLGASRRTGQRWDANGSYPSAAQLQELAKRVHSADPQLAAEIAASLDTTLEGLGIVLAPSAGPAQASPSLAIMVDSVVCAAAEAMDVVPRAVRPALLAAFTRARELQLTFEAVEKALQGKPAPKSVKAHRP